MIIKQTNGKYLIYDFGRGVKINYSQEDIIDTYIERAKEQAKKDMEEANGLDYILKSEIECDNTIIAEKDLQEMGINISKDELIKKVPLKPKDKQYIGCDFTTWAKCPNCNAKVYDSISGTQTKCSECGQMLDWKSDY
jgi:hypothetical protein